MMNRFSTVLQNALDALAPPAPLHEDFVYHWKRLMKHYLDVATVNKVAIELTNIPAHLEQLEKILLKEDAESLSDDSTGPCLEYLLKHNLLDLLATLAVSDDPPGMRQYVLHFVVQILNHIKTPILAHNAVFPSLQRLIEMCNGQCPTPSEVDEVKFVFALAAQLRKHPHLVFVYMTQIVDENENQERKLSVSSSGSNHSSSSLKTLTSAAPATSVNCPPPNNPLFRSLVTEQETNLLVPVEAEVPVSPEPPLPTQEKQPADLPQFPLLSALISYINSADSSVRVKACQGIMLISSLPDDKFAHLIAQHSLLCESLAIKLTALYLEIPFDTDPNHIDDMHATWGLDTPIPLEVEESCEGCRQAATFMGWLDFCDQVAVEGRPAIGTALAKSIRELFFEQEFDPELLPNSLVLALLIKCFKVISSTHLIKEMSEWLVGEGREPELPGVVTCRTMQALLDICAHTNPAVSLEALRLFEVVLEKNIEHIIHCLVLTYVEGRGYYDNLTSPNRIESWSDEEDERERHRDSPDADPCSSMSRTMAPTHIEKIIQSFLNVLPPQLHSAPELGGYQQYVSESQRQYSLTVAVCQTFNWPQEAITDDNLSSDSRPEADSRQFYEGPFLRMIFNRIRELPNQAYEVNLQLTAVISRLALLPHPYLHEYLLSSSVVRRPGPEANSLLGALTDTASQLASRVCTLPDYKSLLQDTRHRLLGHSQDKREDYCSLLESVIVLEEVCKELAAIAFVKFHHAT